MRSIGRYVRTPKRELGPGWSRIVDTGNPSVAPLVQPTPRVKTDYEKSKSPIGLANGR